MKEERQYYTARLLLEHLRHLDDHLLDMPLILIHGKDLTKPNLIQGFVPSPVSVEKDVVEEKKPSLLTLGHLTNLKGK